MSGIDEQPQPPSYLEEEERRWERRIAEQMRASMHTFRPERESHRLNRLLSDGFRRYEEVYEECLTEVLQAEQLNLNRQQIKDVICAMATRIRFINWSRRGMSRWQRFKEWFGNVRHR